jgi:hypothetical protein
VSDIHTAISTTVRVRFPVETLDFINAWAAARQIPRSKAIRELIYRGAVQTGRCDCDSPDACSGNGS